MSGLLAGRVWLSALHPRLKPLAATLADIANDDGTSIFPTVAYVAWRLGCSRRRVQYGMDDLRAGGILTLITPAVGHRPAEYRLEEHKLPARPPWKGARGADFAPLGRSGVQTPTSRGATSSTPGVQNRARSGRVSLNDPSMYPLENVHAHRNRAAAAHAAAALALVRRLSEPARERLRLAVAAGLATFAGRMTRQAHAELFTEPALARALEMRAKGRTLEAAAAELEEPSTTGRGIAI